MNPRAYLLFFCVIFQFGCATTRTAMDDRALSSFFYEGQPLPDEVLAKAKKDWPKDVTLLDMQQGMDILRQGDLSPAEIKRAESYLESAYHTFEDLKDPENFSKAFTPDSKTPYRGRPYERMITAMMLGLIDSANGRCDRAVSAFRAAEFLDARWQAYAYGSDAPLIYAMTLRCQLVNRSSQSDLSKTKDALYKSLRLQLLLEPMLEELNSYSGSANSKDPAIQIALTLLEVGIPSALLVANQDSDISQILQTASAESMRYFSKVLKTKEEPYYKMIIKNLSSLEGSESRLQTAFLEIEKGLLMRLRLDSQLVQVSKYLNRISMAVSKPVAAVYFEGTGPDVIREGQYGEIAQYKPLKQSDLIPGVFEKQIEAKAPCGISNPKDNLLFTLCRHKRESNHLVLDGQYLGLKIWSSSFQATTMAGRRFDKILKGRAQFRMGTEIAAIIGAYTALALLDVGSRERDKGTQTAGLAVGAVALAALIAGRATNPEADIRQVKKNIESGYLLIVKD